MEDVKEIFSITPDKSKLEIDFASLFGHEQLEVYGKLDISARRNFKNMGPSIAATYNELFLEDERLKEGVEVILMQILNVKVKLVQAKMAEQDINTKDLLNMLDKVCDAGDSKLFKIINEFVDEIYDADKISNKGTKKNNDTNSQLYISDNYCKILVKLAYIYRVLIPLVSEFFTNNKGTFVKTQSGPIVTEENQDDIMLDESNFVIFEYIFKKFAPKKQELIYNKIFKITQSRMAPARYTKQRFWTIAKNQNITPDLEIIDIYEKLLINSIPKLEISRELNLVGFFQAVINKQIDYTVTDKFKYVIMPFDKDEKEAKYGTVSEDKAVEFERANLRNHRKDESASVIQQLNIKLLLAKLPEYLDVSVSPEELAEITRSVSMHPVQERVMGMVLNKYFDDCDVIRRLDLSQYALCLLCVKKYLVKMKFRYLPVIITATCKKHLERVQITGNIIKTKVASSKKYQELFTLKYGSFCEEIEKPLNALIGTIRASDFVDVNGDVLFDGTKVDPIADEVLELAFFA